MQTGRKFRIYPTEDQATTLSQWIGCQRVIRNAKIEEANYLCWLKGRAKFNPGTPDERGYERWLREHAEPDPGPDLYFDQTYSQFKTDLNPWLAEVPCQVLRNGVARAKAAFVRYWEGLGGRPKARCRQSEESVLLTRELFQIKDGQLYIGTVKFPVGKIKWKAHRKFDLPASITVIRNEDGPWYCSFTFEDGEVLPTNEDLLVQHAFATVERVNAFDRGVAIPLADSQGHTYGPTPKERKKLLRIDARLQKQQQKLAGQQRGSKRRRKTKAKCNKLRRAKQHITENWRHQTAAAVTRTESGERRQHDVLVFEDLKLANLTRAPKPAPQTPTGTFPPNGAAAKAGLNAALLELGLGRLAELVAYKARRKGLAFVRVPCHHSSQECSHCGHTHPDNRPTQAEFHCQACGFRANADYNASLVLRKRGWAFLQTQQLHLVRPRKSGAVKRSKGVQAPAEKPPPLIGGR